MWKFENNNIPNKYFLFLSPFPMTSNWARTYVWFQLTFKVVPFIFTRTRSIYVSNVWKFKFLIVTFNWQKFPFNISGSYTIYTDNYRIEVEFTNLIFIYDSWEITRIIKPLNIPTLWNIIKSRYNSLLYL